MKRCVSPEHCISFYVLGEVGTARYAVRAAFNGALTGLERLTVQRVPPAGRGRDAAARRPCRMAFKHETHTSHSEACSIL